LPRGDASASENTALTQKNLGYVNIGWTLGEEVLFDRNLQVRQETCYAETESCLLGINKGKLAVLQKTLLEKGNSKDYFVIESTLKGNYLLKTNWRKDVLEGNPNLLAGSGF
jgi:hypothetical protein